MKTIRLILLLVCSLTFHVYSSAQDITDDECKMRIKERRNAQKLTSAALGAKVEKIVRDEVKRLKKEGWKNRPGSLPLEIQLRNFYEKKYSGAKKFPEYIEAVGQATGRNIAYANSLAEALAKTNTAKQIQSEVTSLVEIDVAGKGDEQSVNLVEAAKLITSQKLNKIQIEVEMYREIDGKIEVSIRTLYDGKKARALILQELEGVSSELRDKMENLLNEQK